MGFRDISPGEKSAINRPMYSLFECGIFSKPKAIRGKFEQLEEQLAYFLERQRRRQNNPEVKIEDIVALAGVSSILSWKSLAPIMNQPLDEKKYPLCKRLIKVGRLLVIHVEDPWTKTVTLDDNVRERMPLFLPLHANLY